MRSYISYGQTIEVSVCPFGAFLWLTYGIVVRVAGRTFYPKPTRIGLTTSTEFDFDFEGQRITGCVRTLGPMWFLPRLPYAVLVEGTEIARDVQTLRHWYLLYIAYLVASIVFLLIALGTLTLMYIIGQLIVQ